MPIYEYLCTECGNKLEELQKITDPPIIKCPACGKDSLKRLIGQGAGLIFKGSGFYLTDYKKSSQGKTQTQKEKPSKTESASGSDKEVKKETKSAVKSKKEK